MIIIDSFTELTLSLIKQQGIFKGTLIAIGIFILIIFFFIISVEWFIRLVVYS